LEVAKGMHRSAEVAAMVHKRIGGTAKSQMID